MSNQAEQQILSGLVVVKSCIKKSIGCIQYLDIKKAWVVVANLKLS